MGLASAEGTALGVIDGELAALDALAAEEGVSAGSLASRATLDGDCAVDAELLPTSVGSASPHPARTMSKPHRASFAFILNRLGASWVFHGEERWSTSD